jgi:hypothetical protein
LLFFLSAFLMSAKDAANRVIEESFLDLLIRAEYVAALRYLSFSSNFFPS